MTFGKKDKDDARLDKARTDTPAAEGETQSHKGEKGLTEGEAKARGEGKDENIPGGPEDPDVHPTEAAPSVSVPERTMEVQIEGEGSKKKVQVFSDDVSHGSGGEIKGIRFTVEVPVTEPDTAHQAGQKNIVSQIEQAIGTVGLTHNFNDFNFTWESYDGWEPAQDRGSDAKHDPDGDRVAG